MYIRNGNTSMIKTDNRTIIYRCKWVDVKKLAT